MLNLGTLVEMWYWCVLLCAENPFNTFPKPYTLGQEKDFYQITDFSEGTFSICLATTHY